jgi:hypothetical protein
MRALTARELIAATRSAAVPGGGLVSLVACAAFVLVWSPGAPLLAPLNLYAQTRALQWIVLASVLPYVVVRSSPLDRSDSLELMAALNRTRPATAVVAKVLGSFAVAMVVVLAGLPALILAQQAAAVPMISVAADLLPLAGLALLVASSATGAMVIARDGLRAWLLASGIVFAVVLLTAWWQPHISQIGQLCGLAGALATAGLSTMVAGTGSRGDAHGA